MSQAQIEQYQIFSKMYAQQYVSTQKQCDGVMQGLCTYQSTMSANGQITNFGSVKAGVNNCSIVCAFVKNLLSIHCIEDSDCPSNRYHGMPPFCCSFYMSNCAWTDQDLAVIKAIANESFIPFCYDEDCIAVSSSGIRHTIALKIITLVTLLGFVAANVLR